VPPRRSLGRSMPDGAPREPWPGSARIGPDVGAVATRAILSYTAGSGMDQLLLASRHEQQFAPLPRAVCFVASMY
jgi:hypothetical protein